MLSVLANGSPVCVNTLLEAFGRPYLDNEHDHALAPIGCVCVSYFLKAPSLQAQAPCTPTLIKRGSTKIPKPLSRGEFLLIIATSKFCKARIRPGLTAALLLAPQSSSSLPEATLSSMASRMAFSSNTGP